jgi:hypothetical protein
MQSDDCTKNKPGAFLAWSIPIPGSLKLADLGLPTPQIDPVTGRSCSFKTYEALANWESQFIFYWREAKHGLIQSLLEAENVAFVAGSNPPIYPFLTVAKRPNGDPIIFVSPKVNLMVYGYGNLKFGD